MLLTTICHHCGGIGVLKESPLLQGGLLYKCQDCRRGFVTQDIVAHNCHQAEAIRKVVIPEPQVLYERPYLNAEVYGAVICGFGLSSGPVPERFFGVQDLGGFLVFTLESDGV